MSNINWDAQEAAFFGTTSSPNNHSNGVATGAVVSQTQARPNIYRRYYQDEQQLHHDKAVEDAAETLKQELKSFRKAARNALTKFSSTLNAAIDNDYPGNNNRNHPFPSNLRNGNDGGTIVSIPPPVGQIVSRPRNESTPQQQIRAPDDGISSFGTGGRLVGGRDSGGSILPNERVRPNHNPTTSLMSRVAQRVSYGAKQLGVPSCVVCGVMAPQQYQFHPFFPKERACAHHGSFGKCCSCHRFEPSPQIVKDISDEFADLQDNDRKLCPACMRTVVLDTEDTIPVWNSVLHEFFDQHLHMFESVPSNIKSKMEQIPILMVGHDGLNDPSIVRGSGHGRGGNTRGLCMYEYSYHPLGGSLRHFLEGYTTSNTTAGVAKARATSVLDAVSKGMTRSEVSAILCLKGLPKDLAGSILAHEATHAWFKLHPAFDPQNGQVIPIQIEEGCCQLMAFLYLNYMDELDRNMNNNADDNDYDQETGQPTNKKLRQYFRFCIESDISDIYGDGFRMAADAYAKLGSVQLLLEHVVTHFAFPNL